MLEFMDYVQAAFHAQSRWNRDNSYSSLNTTAAHLLDFDIPHGLRLHVSSLSSPNFGTSYTLGSRGVVDGSLSFLYSSLGLSIPSRSSTVHLGNVVQGYRHLLELQKPEEIHLNEIWRGGKRIDRKDALLYGRLYLPTSTLEALYLRRISPTRLLRLSAVSDSDLPNGGSVLALLQNDYGKYSTEYLYSTDSSLLGIRGLYNFGYDPRVPNAEDIHYPSTRTPAHPWDHQSGRLSAGAEAYFSPMNKSGGISTGLRFATLPIHTGFPYTMTLTLNPLMGNLSSTYAVKAGRNLALCSRFDFNVYSYESDVVVGMELWQRKQASPDVAWANQLLRPGWERAEEEANGVLKARMDNQGKVGLLWECKVKELLVSLGAGFDLKKRERMLGSVGLESMYNYPFYFPVKVPLLDLLIAMIDTVQKCKDMASVGSKDRSIDGDRLTPHAVKQHRASQKDKKICIGRESLEIISNFRILTRYRVDSQPGAHANSNMASMDFT